LNAHETQAHGRVPAVPTQLLAGTSKQQKARAKNKQQVGTDQLQEQQPKIEQRTLSFW
jgi:hypothetical protein